MISGEAAHQFKLKGLFNYYAKEGKMKKTKKKNIKRELPPIGTILNGKFKGIPYNAKIVSSKTNGKSVAFNSKIYKSMSAAACAITKQPTNGWRFWKF